MGRVGIANVKNKRFMFRSANMCGCYMFDV